MTTTSSSHTQSSLLNEPLAFSSDSSLVAATSRIAVETSDGALLNVEIFDHDGNESPVLLFVIPGICESIETKGNQAIVKGALQHKFQGKIAVMELEGHGLSSGPRCLCPSLDKLVNHAVEAVQQCVDELFPKADSISLYFTGNSLGGAISIYVAEKFSTLASTNSTKIAVKGVAPIAAAVGMNPQMLPPSFLVYGLKALAFMAPSLQLSLTPYEDPSHYNLPASTNRNFEGNWPLATSKILLDVTSTRIPRDIEQGKLALSNVPSVLLIAGEKDVVVPIDFIEALYNGISSPKKDMVTIKGAGHDLLFAKKSSDQIAAALFEWIQRKK